MIQQPSHGGRFRWAREVVDVVFPPRCRHCGTGVGVGGNDLCADCEDQLLSQVAHPCCPRCAAQVAPFELDGGRCHECRRQSLRIAATARVGPYDGALRDLLVAYKFRGRENLEPLLVRWLAASIRSRGWLDRIDAITFVPTHWRRRMARNLYPARALAQRTAVALERPFVNVLRRARGGSHQIGLSFTARMANVRGAFDLRRRARPRRTPLLLIDDVRTTGATLEECARVLLTDGAAEVYAAVVCKAEWQHQSAGPITVV
jgi:ComF family protein